MKMNEVPQAVWEKPSYFIAFGFGSGAMPFAPGTFATLMSIPFYLVLAKLSIFTYLAVLIILTIAAIILCDKISQEIQVHDHPGMAIDEFIGYGFTMFMAPHGWFWIFLGFVFFRFFDIVKPPPIKWIDQNVQGGLGMILDDVVAGIFAWFVLQMSFWFFG